MDTLIEVNIDPEFHVSPLPITYVRKQALYIPPLEQCIPKESHYFGLEVFNHPNFTINQETGSVAYPVRDFVRLFTYGETAPFEFAATPRSLITNETDIGSYILKYCIDNFISETLITSYNNLFLLSKSRGAYMKAFRYGTILKRLYSGLKITEMTDDEQKFYNKKKILKREVELTLARLDFDLQELESTFTFEKYYPPFTLDQVNKFLVEIYKKQLNLGE
jgi:hypothetical protein